MRLPSIAGTRAAADLCGECGHARIRHLDGGYGRCSEAERAQQISGRTITVRLRTCSCRRFIDTKEGV